MKIRLSNTQLTTCILLFILFILPAFLHAQPGLGTDDVDDSVPIDGGLSLLVAAGVGYGAKKLKERKTRDKKETSL